MTGNRGQGNIGADTSLVPPHGHQSWFREPLRKTFIFSCEGAAQHLHLCSVCLSISKLNFSMFFLRLHAFIKILFLAVKAQLNTCSFAVSVCLSICLSVSKLNFSMFMCVYSKERYYKGGLTKKDQLNGSLYSRLKIRSHQASTARLCSKPTHRSAHLDPLSHSGASWLAWCNC